MALTKRQCYTILELSESATKDELKAAYRRLAFKLHPDLNPDDPKAAANFQRLNEAYVCLGKVMDKEPPSGKKPGARPGAKPGARPTAGAGEGARAYAEQQRRAGRPNAGPSANGNASFTFKKEEVLHDILKDPFAKQVFEDIYRQVRQTGQAPSPNRSKTLKMEWGDKSVSMDVSKGLFKGVKTWVKDQMDDEQTVYFPLHHLMPGKVIRIRVHQSFSKTPKTVEVRLPPDFVIGRPIRLKGLGRRLGPVKGDLLLRVMPK